MEPIFMLKVLFLQRLYKISDHQIEYQIKESGGNGLWNKHPLKKCHKDIDARWTQKGGVNYYGYKNHAKVDLKKKIITDFVVTSASVHDSQAIESLMGRERDKKGEHLFLDSAYVGYEDVVTKQKQGKETLQD